MHRYVALEAESRRQAEEILAQDECEDAELLSSPAQLREAFLELGFQEEAGRFIHEAEGLRVELRCLLDRIEVSQDPTQPLAPIHEALHAFFAEQELGVYDPAEGTFLAPPARAAQARAPLTCGVCGGAGFEFDCDPACGTVRDTCPRCHIDLMHGPDGLADAVGDLLGGL